MKLVYFDKFYEIFKLYLRLHREYGQTQSNNLENNNSESAPCVNYILSNLSTVTVLLSVKWARAYSLLSAKYT